MELEGFEKWLKDSKKSDLTVKNYKAQINKFFVMHGGDLAKLMTFTLELPNPMRKSAALAWLGYLESLGQDTKETAEGIRKFKVRTKERKGLDTTNYGDVGRVARYAQEHGEEELAIVLKVAFDTGARIRAILRLRKKDCITEGDAVRLMIRQETDRKRESDKYLRQSTSKEFIAYFSDKNNPWLFFEKRPSMQDLDNRYNNLLYRLQKCSRAALNSGMAWHWVRRGIGVEIYEASGNDIVAASEFLNDNPNTAVKYLKLKGARAKQIIRNDKREWS